MKPIDTSSPRQVDSLIFGRWLITMAPQSKPIEYGGVAIQNDRIVDADSTQELEQKYRAKSVFHFPQHLIMPGLVNAHTHAAMTLFRGLADDLPLMDWLQGYIFPAESKLTKELVYAGTQIACLEMLLSGTTTFCDMYLFEKSVAQAARDMKMRAVVGEVLYDFPSPNYGPPEAGFHYTEELIQQWQGDPLIVPAVEPHSPYTCSPELLKKSKKIAEKYGVSFIIHLAETMQEVQIIQERYGKNPVQHLKSLGVLDHQVLADHCIWLKDQDIESFGELGVRVAHAPESNMKLASGVAPIPRLLQKGIPVGLGTDGCASNNNLDLFQEMDVTAKLHKVFAADPTAMDAKTVLEMATVGGARAVGLEAEIGTLEPGKKADCIVIDLNKPHLVPLYNIYSHLVYSACGADVDSVWINGELIVKNRLPVVADMGAILGQVEDLKAKVLGFLKKE
ncbi:MAG: amidohydrolase [bacterium]